MNNLNSDLPSHRRVLAWLRRQLPNALRIFVILGITYFALFISVRHGQAIPRLQDETPPTDTVPADTEVPTELPTDTVAPSPTDTVAPSPTDAPVDTPTDTQTPVDTLTNTAVPTPTPIDTPSDTLTPSDTPTGTLTPSATFTSTYTNSPTHSITPTNTNTRTFTPTHTPIPSDTELPTDTVPPGFPTSTPRPTKTPRPTETEPPTQTRSASPTATVSFTTTTHPTTSLTPTGTAGSKPPAPAFPLTGPGSGAGPKPGPIPYLLFLGILGFGGGTYSANKIMGMRNGNPPSPRAGGADATPSPINPAMIGAQGFAPWISGQSPVLTPDEKERLAKLETGVQSAVHQIGGNPDLKTISEIGTEEFLQLTANSPF